MNCAFSFDGYERDVKSVNNYFTVVWLKCLLNDGENNSGNRIWKIIFYFLPKLLEKTNTTMFHTKNANRENPYYLALLKTMVNQRMLSNTVNTLKGPEVFSLNSVSSLLIALMLNFCLQWPVDKCDSEL